MPQGLQVWSRQGKKLLDSSLQTSSILGVVNVTSTGTQVITDARFSWGTPFFLADSMYTGNNIKVTFTGTSMTISTTSANTGYAPFVPVKIYYGVF